MTSVEAVFATALSPGDTITELDTPSGPWYTVLSLGRDGVTVDGSLDDEVLPVPLSVGPRDLVLRRERC